MPSKYDARRGPRVAPKEPKQQEAVKAASGSEFIPLPRRIAIAAVSAPFASVAASEQFTKEAHPDIDIKEMATALRESMNRVRAGDMSGMEDILVGQAHALQQVFVSLMRRSTAQTSLKTLTARAPQASGGIDKNWRAWEKSTGAKTPQGKRASSRNAYKGATGKRSVRPSRCLMPC